VLLISGPYYPLLTASTSALTFRLNMADGCTSTVLGKRKPAGALPWEHVKPDVFRIYILEGQTLNVTMTEIEAIYGLTAKFVEEYNI
jgi:hypothetical protein